jgi:hypothetical protein
VIDSVTSKPIPYVAVSFGNGDGGYTDESGMVKIPNRVKEIMFYHVSFENKAINTTHLQDNEKILLSIKPVVLNEVVVLPKKQKIEKIGYYNLKIKYPHYSTKGLLFAQYIDYEKKSENKPVITGIILKLNPKQPYVFQLTNDNVITLKAKLRVDLRLPDERTGAPSDISLLDDGGIICPDNYKKNKAFTLPLRSPLTFPKEGVFIVVEWLMPEETKFVVAAPAILFAVCSTYKSTTWMKRQYLNKDWILMSEDEGEKATNEMYYKGENHVAAFGLTIMK